MLTPVAKRQRRESTSSHKVLKEMKDGHVDEGKSFKALCSCVVRAANEEAEEEIQCLEELLREGANPNYNEHSLIEVTAGSPLYLAIKLNVPRAVELLLQRGASLITKYDNKSSLQVSISLFIYFFCL